MARTNSTLATVLALALGATAAACTPEPTDGAGGSTGGSPGAGGRAAGTGGTVAGTGGTVAGTGGTVAGTGGGGGTPVATGGSPGSGGTPGTGGSSTDTAGPTDTGGGETPTGGKLVITVEQDAPMGDRKCFKPTASNSKGNHAPKMDWTAPPAGTKSLFLTTFDKTNGAPHQIVCNIPPDVLGMPADFKAMLPPGAEAGYGFGGKPFWFGPGAGGGAHAYEITIWAIATEKFEGGCKGDGSTAFARAAYKKLAAAKDNKAIVLDSATETLWGNVDGSCK